MGRKVFNFAIEIDGIDQILIQDVKKPENEIGAVAHGVEDGFDEKTAGGTTVSDAELQKIKPADTGDSWAWDWLTTAQTSLPSNYKKDVVFKEYGPNNVVLNRWLWEGCWVRKVSESNYKRGNKSENTIETVTVSVDRVRKLQ